MLSTILWMTVLLVIPTAQAKTPTEYCTDLTAAGTTYTSITTKTIQGPTNCVNDLQNGNTGSATQYLTSLGNAVSADVSGVGNPDDITTKLDEQRNLKNGIATDIASLCSQADELADILTLIVIRTGSCEQSFEVYKTFSNVLSGPSTTFINQATPVKTELQRILTDVQNGINSVLAVSIVIIGYNTVAKQTESILNPLGMSIADQEAMVQRMLTELTRRMTLVQNSGDLSTLVTKIETDRTSLTAKETEICTVVHDTGNVIGSGFSKVVCISSFDTAMISSIETLVVTFTDSVTNLNALTTTIGSLNTDLGNVMPVTASPTDAPTTESPQDSTTNPQTTVMTTSPATNGVTTEATTMQNMETSAAVTTETSTVETTEPTTAETTEPTTAETTAPTTEPTTAETTAPTTEPTTEPTTAETTAPTTEPTTAPTTEPTTEPTTAETTAPTTEPTTAETTAPTTEPTTAETTAPTTEPTTAETTEPTTVATTVEQDTSGTSVMFTTSEDTTTITSTSSSTLTTDKSTTQGVTASGESTAPVSTVATTAPTTVVEYTSDTTVQSTTSNGTTNATTTFTFRDIEWWYQQFTEFSPEKSLTHWEENQIVIISSLVGALVLLIVIIIVITSVAVYIRRRRRRGKYDNIE